jgi:hypothetical protein
VAYVLLGVLIGPIVLCVLAALLRGDGDCLDSPDGLHEDMIERTPDGVCLSCCWCGRMTNGIDAFHRKV